MSFAKLNPPPPRPRTALRGVAAVHRASRFGRAADYLARAGEETFTDRPARDAAGDRTAPRDRGGGGRRRALRRAGRPVGGDGADGPGRPRGGAGADRAAARGAKVGGQADPGSSGPIPRWSRASSITAIPSPRSPADLAMMTGRAAGLARKTLRRRGRIPDRRPRPPPIDFERGRPPDAMTEIVSLADGELALDIAPEIGGAIVGFRIGDTPILRETTDEAPRERGRDEAVELSARSLLRPHTPGRASASAARSMRSRRISARTRTISTVSGWRSRWAVGRRDAASVTLVLEPRSRRGPEGRRRWPFAMRAELTYALGRGALSMTLAVVEPRRPPDALRARLPPLLSPAAPARRCAFAPRASGCPTRTRSRRGARPPQATPTFRTPKDVDSVTLDNAFSGFGGTAELAFPDRKLGADRRPRRRFLALRSCSCRRARISSASSRVSHMPDAINRMAEVKGPRPAHPRAERAPRGRGPHRRGAPAMTDRPPSSSIARPGSARALSGTRRSRPSTSSTSKGPCAAPLPPRGAARPSVGRFGEPREHRLHRPHQGARALIAGMRIARTS